jgi:hypothetical protein
MCFHLPQTWQVQIAYEATAVWGLGAPQNGEGAKMDASLLIGAPLGLGLLLALGGLMVVMSYLSQWGAIAPASSPLW